MRTKLASYKQLSLMRSPSILASICLFSFLLLDLSILLLCAFIKCKFVSQLRMWINFYSFQRELTLMNSFLCWILSSVDINQFFHANIWTYARKFVKKYFIFCSFFSQNKKRIDTNKGVIELNMTSSRETTEIWEEMKHFFYLCAASLSAISEVRARKKQKLPNYCFRDKKTWS